MVSKHSRLFGPPLKVAPVLRQIISRRLRKHSAGEVAMKHVCFGQHPLRASRVRQSLATCVSASDLSAPQRCPGSGRCFPSRMNVIPRRSGAAVTLVTRWGNLHAAKRMTRMPCWARLSSRTNPPSASPGGASEPCIHREPSRAQAGWVTSARWHRGCFVYA